MGRVTEIVKVQNLLDVFNAAEGTLAESDVRMVEVEAVVDTGAAHLCLPPAVIETLGLFFSHSQPVRTANGTVKRRIFKGADVTIMERNTETVVMENDDETPPLIGYLLLETFDFVVDPKAQKIIPNPDHDGKWIMDLY